MGEIHRVVSVSFRHGLALVRGNLHRPYGFGRNGTVFGVAPPHNVEALARLAPPNPVPLHSEISYRYFWRGPLGDLAFEERPSLVREPKLPGVIADGDDSSATRPSMSSENA